MSEHKPKHLVLVRHGQSEGDARREAWKRGEEYTTSKHPKDEGQTELGHKQSQQAGRWIAQFILKPYSLDKFDAHLTSPLPRTLQSANSLDPSAKWVREPALTERDRGAVQGMTKKQHQEQFPDSYEHMLEHPFHWTPPEGESLLRVADRLTTFLDSLLSSNDTALLMTHRDLMWSAHLPLDGLNLSQIEQVDTNAITNAHIFHYTNINPKDGSMDDTLRWKRSIDPCNEANLAQNDVWIDLKR